MAVDARSWGTFAGLALVALAACSPVEPGNSAWMTRFGAGGPPALSIRGSVGAISRGIGTQASIEITGAAVGASYQWRIREGTCAQPGGLLGGRASYPVLTPGSNGVATADAQLSRRMQVDGSYQATVLLGIESDTTVVACGLLEPA